MKLIDLTGSTFGRLTVLRRHPVNSGKRVQWVCICECGVEKIVTGHGLTSGDTKSCGCLARESVLTRSITHGMSGHPLHNVWNSMIQRCYNEKSASYKNYGARGIRVCSRWRESFENFYADMGERPTNEHSIERLDGNKDYQPDNCVWATRKEQARNKRNNRIGLFQGRLITVAELADITGIPQGTLMRRVSIAGYSFEKAAAMGAGARKYTHNGKTLTLKEWGEELNMSRKTLWQKLNRGSTIADLVDKESHPPIKAPVAI